jgi:hypothetical protein
VRASWIALLASVLLLAGCGDDEEPAGPAATATASATPSATNTATITPSPTTTATATEAPEVLWPDPSASDPVEPLAVAKSFVIDFIGIEDPAMGEFREAEPNAGEVDVFRRGEDGGKLDKVVATIQLRRLGGERWFVTTVGSEEVEIESPDPYAEIGSPVTITGRGRGFEGNVVLEVRRAYETQPLARKPVTAGSMGDLEPFEAQLTFDAPPGTAGAIVARTGSGIAAADGFAAFPVRLSG